MHSITMQCMLISGTFRYVKTNMSVQNTLAKVILQNSHGESLTLEQHEIGKIVKTSWINLPNNCAPLSLVADNFSILDFVLLILDNKVP